MSLQSPPMERRSSHETFSRVISTESDDDDDLFTKPKEQDSDVYDMELSAGKVCESRIARSFGLEPPSRSAKSLFANARMVSLQRAPYTRLRRSHTPACSAYLPPLPPRNSPSSSGATRASVPCNPSLSPHAGYAISRSGACQQERGSSPSSSRTTQVQELSPSFPPNTPYSWTLDPIPNPLRRRSFSPTPAASSSPTRPFLGRTFHSALCVAATMPSASDASIAATISSVSLSRTQARARKALTADSRRHGPG